MYNSCALIHGGRAKMTRLLSPPRGVRLLANMLQRRRCCRRLRSKDLYDASTAAVASEDSRIRRNKRGTETDYYAVKFYALYSVFLMRDQHAGRGCLIDPDL